MKWLLAFLLLNLSVFAQQASVPVIEYSSVPNFLKLPPDRYLGEMAGVAVNSKGHVFALSRGNTTGPAYGAAASQLLEFGPDGKFIREIGHNLYAWSFGHSVKIDPEDNIWVADKGSDMVIKFDPEGRVVMVFGRKQEASDEGTEPLKHPKPPLARRWTECFARSPTWRGTQAGNTYISDGYINSRVAKVDKNGNWLKSWGEPGDKPGQFSVPHSIAVDAQGTMSTWRIAATAASRSLTATANSCARSRSMCLSIPKPDPAIGHKPTQTDRRQRAMASRVALGDLHHAADPIRCCTAPMPIRAGSTS